MTAVAALVCVVPLVSAAVPGEQTKIAVLEPSGQDTTSADARKAVGALIASRLDDSGAFSVITQEDVRQMITFDRLKTALTCEDEASCLAEIGGALGVPWLVSSTLADVGGTTVLSMSLVDIDGARVLRRETVTASDLGALISSLPEAVDKLVRPLLVGRQGTLEVRVDVAGAVVELDERIVGQTPMAALTVAQGTHRVVVKKAGHFDFEKVVDVGAGETVVVEAALSEVEYTYVSPLWSLAGLGVAAGGLSLGAFGYLGSVVVGLQVSRVAVYSPYSIWWFVPVVGSATSSTLIVTGHGFEPGATLPGYLTAGFQMFGLIITVVGLATAVAAFFANDILAPDAPEAEEP